MKIVLDAMGGDSAPMCIVEGALMALEQIKDLEVVLTGKEDEIKKYLQVQNDRIQIVNCSQVITNEESPTLAIKEKYDSSLVVGFDILRKGNADALISAGSTGAILAGGYLRIGRIKGISRPALAPVLPTKNDGKVIIVDSGANVNCKAINLLDFAIMGNAYMQTLGVKNPRVALLSVGDEQGKGNDLTKEVFDMLSNQKDINFVGNKEARDILTGCADVFVCDGFAGNVALKACEGTASFVMSEIKNVFKGLSGKLAGLLVMPKLKKIKSKLDYNKYGGSIFLGCNKIIIKSHGSSKPVTICQSIKQAYNLYKQNILQKISDAIQERDLQNA